MATKYNTQKHSKGRSQNRENKKDSTTMVNEVYLVGKSYENLFYIDSLYTEDTEGWRGEENKKYKSIYFATESNIEDKVEFCLIDETMELDCDFMENLPKVYSKIEKNIIVTNIDDINIDIKTLISPSQYDSETTYLEEVEGFKGFHFEVGIFNIFKTSHSGWTISGHSESLINKDGTEIDVNKLDQLSSLGFLRLFEDLKYN